MASTETTLHLPLERDQESKKIFKLVSQLSFEQLIGLQTSNYNK